jgi:hypothetical protein
MKAVLFAALAGSAAAFAPQSASKASTAVNGAMEDLKDIAEKSNPVLKVSGKNAGSTGNCCSRVVIVSQRNFL